VVEPPTYDLTIFKVHYGKMTLKIYTKGAPARSASKSSRTIPRHTVRAGRCRALGEIVSRLHGILERFLNAVGCMDACFVADDTLENLPLPTQVGQTRVRGDRFQQAPHAPGRGGGSGVIDIAVGFTASVLARKVVT
jgi:hypothetical protein